MSHDYHAGQENYSPAQVLHDGCNECAWRSEHVTSAIDSMDTATFARAWQRAGTWLQDGLDDMAIAEHNVFKVLAAVQRRLEVYGIPIGVLPGSAGAPVVISGASHD